ncbi:MAG TPA: archaeosortase/exosortase family protein [Rhizomicrobium sp.]|nr:archaeosortase/exosortase family protein [Rhizomicrobium sp.]
MLAAAGSQSRFAVAQNPIAWTGGIFFARYLADGVRDFLRGDPVSLGHLANLGIFQLIAWFAVLHLIGSRPRWISDGATALVGLISLSAVLPDDGAAWVGLTAFAMYILAAFPKDRPLRAAAAVMLALATQLFWGHLLFELVAFRIEAADAWLAAELLKGLHHAVSLQGNLIGTESHQIVVYDACTSFHNVSVALLAFVSITKLSRLDWNAGDLVTAAGLILVTVMMNSLRLFLMASSAPGQLEFWHTGMGSQAINASLSALIAILCLHGATIRRA